MKALAKSLWPLAVLLSFTAWITYPIYTAKNQLFSLNLAGDGIKAAWAYDFVARQLAEGHWFSHFTDFDYPKPLARWVDYPNLGDAILSAPLAWLFDWPLQWAATQVLVALCCGLGALWLAYEAGARSHGLVFAGCMGVCYRPIWRELSLGRINGAWIGIFLLTVAAYIRLARLHAGEIDERRGPLLKGLMVVLCALLGALSLTTYPPNAILIAPLGTFLLLPYVRSRPASLLPLLLLPIALGLALAWPELSMILERQGGLQVPCDQLRCPLDNWAAYGNDLSITWPNLDDIQLVRGGMSLSVWALLPLALLRRKRAHWIWPTVLVGALYIFLSLGPCPAWLRSFEGEGRLFESASPWTRSFWCQIEPIHDFSRFLQIAGVMSVVVIGAGIEPQRAKPLWLKVITALLAFACVTHSALFLKAELLEKDYWSPVFTPTTAAFLKTAETGPVAELPWDESQQYWSLMEAPQHPRVNPLNVRDPVPSNQPFIQWLQALAVGQAPPPEPTRKQVDSSGLRWVFHDANRCKDGMTQGEKPCNTEVVEQLNKVLGEGTTLGPGVLLWDIKANPN